MHAYRTTHANGKMSPELQFANQIFVQCYFSRKVFLLQIFLIENVDDDVDENIFIIYNA